MKEEKMLEFVFQPIHVRRDLVPDKASFREFDKFADLSSRHTTPRNPIKETVVFLPVLHFHLKDIGGIINMINFLPFISSAFGWIYFSCWGISAYPQFLLHIRLHSVEGVSFDFLHLNTLGFFCLVLSIFLLLFSPKVREEYAHRNPGSTRPLVEINDAAFALHGFILAILTLSQVYLWGYKRRKGQKVHPVSWIIIIISLLVSLIAWIIAKYSLVTSFTTLDVAYLLGFVKILASTCKYIPQAYLHYQRKCTYGWSIFQIILDLTGGVLSCAQLLLDAYISEDWRGISGNPMKMALGLLTIFFDAIFMVQHYILYYGNVPDEEEAPLIAEA